MKKINVSLLKQNVPAYFYKRLNTGLVNQPSYFIIPIDYGFAYLLRSIRTKWTGAFYEEGVPIADIQMKSEFVQSHSNRELQNEPVDFTLFSTPGRDGEIFVDGGTYTPLVVANPAPNPVDDTAFNINFSAQPVKNNIILNYFYQRRENLYLKITFTPRLASEFGFLDVLLIGYYIPDLSLKEWA